MNRPRLESLRDYTISELGPILYSSAQIAATALNPTAEASSSSEPDIDGDSDLTAAIAASLITDFQLSPSKSTTIPLQISPKESTSVEIISRELCGINPNTNMCNAKFKDKDCVQILKNGRKVCVKANTI